ncbi:NERD domain-containing protein [Neobacillus cucumis]|uniref:NERD domain-containing protein n=1 Tax=Neobacillus cucumis TaxID=1740721 RepID=UPI002E22ED47|nr:NERD domain-containing protein [Neobacillus cucumis]
MFVKKLRVPIILQKSEALERRLPKNHSAIPDLKAFIKKLRSGYNGESKISYYLSQIPSKRFYIFHDLRLPYGDGYFQIDVLLLSSKAIFIVDGKNHSGKLTIDINQMTQEYQENRIVYENPISQGNRHKLLLSYFFEKYEIPTVPIESLAVICKPTTELVISPGYTEAVKKVCRLSDLLEKLDRLYQQYNRERLDQKTLEKIKKLLLKKHIPLNTNLFEKFSISKEDVKSGVQCPNCLFIPMEYKRNYWKCPVCQFFSREVLLNAMKDYFLLGNSSFTNMEIRSFLHLPSSRITTNVISLLNFPYTGTTKGRIYQLTKDFL